MNFLKAKFTNGFVSGTTNVTEKLLSELGFLPIEAACLDRA